MSKKEKLRKEIKGAWNDLRYTEDNDEVDSKDAIYFRGVYDGLVMTWDILYGEDI